MSGRKGLILIIAILSLAVTVTSVKAEDQPKCMTTRNVEIINKGNISRIHDFKGTDAKLYLALDPDLLGIIWQYQNRVDLYKKLMEKNVDEIVLWKVKTPGSLIGAVGAFVNGCLVEDYAGKESLEKIIFISEASAAVKTLGVENDIVKLKIKVLCMYGKPGMKPEELDSRIKKMTDRVKAVLYKDSPRPSD